MNSFARLLALCGLALISSALLLTWPLLHSQADTPLTTLDGSPPSFPNNPLLAPPHGASLTDATPGFDWADAVDPDGGIYYTLRLTGSVETLLFTTTQSHFTPGSALSNGAFAWSVRATDTTGQSSAYVTPPYTFSLQASWHTFLPLLSKPETPVCPTSSNLVYNLIEVTGPATDRPDYLHGDLNLSLRGYNPTSAPLSLINYSGSSDPNAPQLTGLFEPSKFPGISAVHRVNDWNWGCGAHGCPGPPLTNFPVTFMNLKTTPGEPIFIPERSPEIFGGGYKALVLYAEAQRITLGYTRQDTVANGYAVHLENVCVDPNLLALYQSRVNGAGWRIAPLMLPALRHNQTLGTALGNELGVAIRDRGAFMDPRSRKDWWLGVP